MNILCKLGFHKYYILESKHPEEIKIDVNFKDKEWRPNVYIESTLWNKCKLICLKCGYIHDEISEYAAKYIKQKEASRRTEQLARKLVLEMENKP